MKQIKYIASFLFLINFTVNSQNEINKQILRMDLSNISYDIKPHFVKMDSAINSLQKKTSKFIEQHVRNKSTSTEIGITKLNKEYIPKNTLIITRKKELKIKQQ